MGPCHAAPRAASTVCLGPKHPVAQPVRPRCAAVAALGQLLAWPPGPHL
jgi:hypothetical protein